MRIHMAGNQENGVRPSPCTPWASQNDDIKKNLFAEAPHPFGPVEKCSFRRGNIQYIIGNYIQV